MHARALELLHRADERQGIANRAMGVPFQNALAKPCAVVKEVVICIGWVQIQAYWCAFERSENRGRKLLMLCLGRVVQNGE